MGCARMLSCLILAVVATFMLAEASDYYGGRNGYGNGQKGHYNNYPSYYSGYYPGKYLIPNTRDNNLPYFGDFSDYYGYVTNQDHY